MEFMTKSEFDELKKRYGYFGDRWRYFKEVINLIKEEKFDSVLELGPAKKSIVKFADVMDFSGDKIPNLKYKWDATKTPWPIEDKKYDLFIALQVWEHLYEKKKGPCWEGPKQREAFREVMRISKNAILSFPFEWHCPRSCPSHHNITKKKIAEWTLNVKPVKKIRVYNHKSIKKRFINFLLFRKIPSRIIYFFKFDD